MMATAHINRDFRLLAGCEYDHVQRAPLYWLLMGPSLVLAVVATLTLGNAPFAVALFGSALFMAILGFSFRSLRVRDEDEYLALRWGPVPIFRKRFRYTEILSATPDRTTVADGWGIHWVPGRGWTYNLWGFDCVRLELTHGRTARVGSDDVRALAGFVEKRLREMR